MSITEGRKARVRKVLSTRLSSLVVVIEAVHRRHNVSAILRSAESFGIHEVHLITGTFRPSRGAARGAERWLELTRHAELEPCIESLKGRGFSLWVADFSPSALSPDAIPIDGPVAILFGSELNGVSPEARELADGVVCIPTWGLTQSLNVSVAAACTLQRVAGRRREHLGGGDLSVERQERFYQDWMVREKQSRRGMAARVGPSSNK